MFSIASPNLQDLSKNDKEKPYAGFDVKKYPYTNMCRDIHRVTAQTHRRRPAGS